MMTDQLANLKMWFVGRLRSSYYKHHYFEGDIYRYTTTPRFERFIAFDDSLREKPSEFRWFTGPRILLRRLVNRRFRLMASAVHEEFITNKNLYVLIPRSIELYAMLGILNSRLMSYMYVRQLPQATKDDFAQVTIKDLLSLPCPAEVPTMVQQRIAAWAREISSQNSPSKNIERKIDEAVYSLYGLSEQQVQEVEHAIL